MALTYIGTRDRSIKATASEAILRGICPDGGLYIPEEIPKMENPWRNWEGWTIGSWRMRC